jgi:hypothetical protein
MINKPIDANNRVINEAPPAVVALEETYYATVSSSTAITLNTATTYLEVSAIDKGIFMKWGGTASSSDFDEFIPANQTRAFVKPTGQTSVQFIEETATAKLVVIEK